MADLVLWKPAFFGVKPTMIIKGGFIAAAQMGDPNASIPTPQPVHYREMFGALGKAVNATSATFVSKAAIENNVKEQFGLDRMIKPCSNVRSVRKTDMVHNAAMPKVEVDPQTYEVKADGVLLSCEPAEVLPMAQRYFLF